MPLRNILLQGDHLDNRHKKRWICKSCCPSALTAHCYWEMTIHIFNMQHKNIAQNHTITRTHIAVQKHCYSFFFVCSVNHCLFFFLLCTINILMSFLTRINRNSLLTALLNAEYIYIYMSSAEWLASPYSQLCDLWNPFMKHVRVLYFFFICQSKSGWAPFLKYLHTMQIFQREVLNNDLIEASACTGSLSDY